MNKVFILLLVFTGHFSFAQLEIRALSKKAPIQSARIAGDTTTGVAILPFWDDFSKAGNSPRSFQVIEEDTFALWDLENSTGVFVSPTLSIVPPTYKAATFDGLNDEGQAYNDDGTIGITDILMSCPIDLSNAEKTSTFISFYWQAEGNVERPDNTDSLVLEISLGKTFHPDSTKRLWSVGGGDNLPPKDTFNLAGPFEITDPYFTDSTRIRFYSFGDTDGSFDAWHIDWVYLNDGRSSNETIFDASWTNQLISPFAPFRSIPADLFQSDPSKFIKDQEVYFSFLGGILGVSSVSYVHSIVNELENHIFYKSDTLSLDSRVNDALNELEDPQNPPLKFDINIPLAISDINFQEPNIKDSILLVSRLNGIGIEKRSLISQSTQKRIDLEINDSISDSYLLHNYYAYDDGTAEFAAGTNRNNAQVAIKYWLENIDTLTAVDFYFPRIDPFSDGVSLNLKILSELADNDSTGVISSTPITVSDTSGINAFTRYKFSRPIILPADTFYVAYQQSTVDGRFVGIGLDKGNPMASEFIFENFEREWVPVTRINGALMIRPVFENGIGIDTLGIDPFENTSIIYPNPTKGSISVSGEYEKLEVFDLSGSRLFSEPRKNTHYLPLKKGLYIIRLYNKDKFTVKKIIRN